VIKLFIRNLRLFSKSRKEPYLLFRKVLGFYPEKIEYYQLAVRHRSVAIPTDDGHLLNNERLEFLGDAVLNSVVTDILYRRYENQREGFLTNTRSKIVKRDSLNQLALDIGLENSCKLRNMLIPIQIIISTAMRLKRCWAQFIWIMGIKSAKASSNKGC